MMYAVTYAAVLGCAHVANSRTTPCGLALLLDASYWRVQVLCTRAAHLISHLYY
jgi:hypothetical protein